MTLEQIERLCDKQAIAHRMWASWGKYKNRVYDIKNNMVFASGCGVTPINEMGIYDEDVYKFVSKLCELEEFARQHMEMWGKRLDVVEDILNSPEVQGEDESTPEGKTHKEPADILTQDEIDFLNSDMKLFSEDVA